MKNKITALLTAIAGLALITGCTTISPLAYNPPAYKPHNPNNVRVDLSLSKEQVYVMEGNRCLLAAACTVGIPGKPTPRGHFRIYSKQPNKRSGSYGYWVKGGSVIPGESNRAPGSGYHYVGYPMQWWCEFAPAYGFHQGFVWPVPRSHGCVRMHKTVAPKFYELVKIGTPVNVANSQPEDATVGAHLPRPRDYQDADPAPSYMVSSAVFQKPAGMELIENGSY